MSAPDETALREAIAWARTQEQVTPVKREPTYPALLADAAERSIALELELAAEKWKADNLERRCDEQHVRARKAEAEVARLTRKLMEAEKTP